MSKPALQGLQILLAPVRLCYRCFCRWAWPAFSTSFMAIFYCLGFLGGAVIVGLAYLLRALHTTCTRTNKTKTKSTPPMSELHSVYTGAGPGTSVLERLLTIDDLFYQLAKHTHAGDLLHLTRVSSTCHKAVKQHWASQSCQKILCFGTAERCFGCGMPVCTTGPHKQHCGWATTGTLSEPARQRNELQAVCTACYFLNLCMPRETFRRLQGRCTGERTEHITTQFDFRMPLCTFCERLCKRNNKEAQLYKLRDTRAYRQSKLSVMHYDPATCSSCGAGLWAITIRWWRCSTCHLECRKDVKVYGIDERWRQLKATVTGSFVRRSDG